MDLEKFFAGEYSEEELAKLILSNEDIDTILEQEVSEKEAQKIKENKEHYYLEELAVILKKHPASELLIDENDYARWTRAYINSLPNASFAVIEPAYTKGETKNKNARHLPHHNEKGGGTANENLDLPHLRNALARMNQIKPVTDSISADELRRKASTHLEKHRSALEGNRSAEAEKMVKEVNSLRINNKVLLEQNSKLKTENEELKTKTEKRETEINELKIKIGKKEKELKEVKDTNVGLQETAKKDREDLIKEILEMGIKLHGNSYDRETNEKMLKEPARTLDEIKNIREQYLKELDEKFPRKQTDASTLELGTGQKQDLPDEAFEQK